MVLNAEHGIRFKSYHLPYPKNTVLGYARMVRGYATPKTKKPAITRAYERFNAKMREDARGL